MGCKAHLMSNLREVNVSWKEPPLPRYRHSSGSSLSLVDYKENQTDSSSVSSKGLNYGNHVAPQALRFLYTLIPYLYRWSPDEGSCEPQDL